MADENKKYLTLPWSITGLVIIVSIVVCSMTLMKAEKSRVELIKARKDTQAAIVEESKKVAADMEQKYQADRISYEVMSRQFAGQQNAFKDPVKE